MRLDLVGKYLDHEKNTVDKIPLDSLLTIIFTDVACSRHIFTFFELGDFSKCSDMKKIQLS